MRVAVYPGLFDPITMGHVDVMRRALGVFDRVVVAVLANPKKVPALDHRGPRGHDPRRRGRGARRAGRPGGRRPFDGLTVDACRRLGARSLVRGLRAVSDFEAELQMAHMNPGWHPRSTRSSS